MDDITTLTDTDVLAMFSDAPTPTTVDDVTELDADAIHVLASEQ